MLAGPTAAVVFLSVQCSSVMINYFEWNEVEIFLHFRSTKSILGSLFFLLAFWLPAFVFFHDACSQIYADPLYKNRIVLLIEIVIFHEPGNFRIKKKNKQRNPVVYVIGLIFLNRMCRIRWKQCPIYANALHLSYDGEQTKKLKTILIHSLHPLNHIRHKNFI